jgi:hypothetical protein
MAATINIILLQNTDIYTVSKLQEHCFYLSLYLSLYIYIYTIHYCTKRRPSWKLVNIIDETHIKYKSHLITLHRSEDTIYLLL